METPNGFAAIVWRSHSNGFSSAGGKTVRPQRRKYRSVARPLFTYGKRQHTDGEWAIKISKYFWPQVFSNKFVKHGIQYELTARDVYIKNTGNNVIISGFITSKKCPWLGYSPYGVVLDTLNNPKKLIEIKCPFKGSLVGLTELLSNVNFLVQGTDGQ
ncbi:unnamed protein product [Macrosiphum euphorbiae]|nr:unnamed protein product [Macrosiphum euphorbiae]